MATLGSRYQGLGPHWRVLAQVTETVRLLRGPLLTAIAAAAVLYAPDQVRELYRITVSDWRWEEMLLNLAAILVLSLTLWWIAYRTLEFLGNPRSGDPLAVRWARLVLPGIAGALTPLGAAAGLLAAIPDDSRTSADFTSPWATIAGEIAADMTSGLRWGAAALAAMGVLVLLIGIVVAGLTELAREQGRERRAPALDLFSILGLLISLAIVIGVTVAVVRFPIDVPVALGTIPLLCLFFLAIALMAGQMTFWHEVTGTPVFIVLGLAVLVFSAFDLNDNHELRAVKDAEKAAPRELREAYPADVFTSFAAWYRARPDRDRYTESYPVYLVAAQGGGIYAAYHTATFLSRMQDLCPAFRDHLFAISSVSGGSLGAAVFAASVKASAQKSERAAESASPSLPCPAMERSGLNRKPLSRKGEYEARANAVLSRDYLAPLAAATLFPDFTQRFLPASVPEFDRARWLEKAFEEGWKEASGIEGENPFDQSYLKLWAAEGSTPALLINTTEADSGRRLIISPFLMEHEAREPEALLFPLWDQVVTRAGLHAPCTGRDIALSTAVGLSARFPWLTPAGSLTTDCNEKRNLQKTRIVDGGYFDNSGVETAIDVIDRIERELARSDGRMELDGKTGPKIDLHLIVLTTSEYPERGAYGLGDAMEPIRALLSAREARAPIVISRASRRLATREPPAPDETAALGWLPELELDRLHAARFRNPIYRTPLGWRLSKATQSVIDIQTGRFHDCSADLKLRQTDQENFSNADCIQLIVYHQLNETMASELTTMRGAEMWRRKQPPSTIPPPSWREPFLVCYDNALRRDSMEAYRKSLELLRSGTAKLEPDRLFVPERLQRRQRDAFDQILRLWNETPAMQNPRWLAYMLAVVEQETGGVPFREGGCLSEKCSIRTLEKLEQTLHSSAIQQVLKPDEKGRRYYGRGFLQLSSAQNYRRVSTVTGLPVLEEPDLLLMPEVSARVLFAWMTDPRLSPNRTLDRFTTEDDFDVETAFETYRGGRLAKDNPLVARLRARVVKSYERFYACLGKTRALTNER